MKLFKSIGFSVVLMGLLTAALFMGCDNGSITGGGDEDLTVSLSSSDQTTATIAIKATEDVTLYYVVYNNKEAAPSADEIIADADVETASLYTDITRVISISGLTDETGYVCYAVTVNPAGEQSSVYSVSFTTSAYTYPIDSNTEAFWIFSRDDVSNGDTVSAGETGIIVEDLTGNGNDLYLESNSNTDDSSLSPLMWVEDSCYDHAKNNYSLLFSGSIALDGGFYLRTEDEAPLNSEKFDGTGYTIEVIVKIDDDFTSSDNKWMGILSLSYPYDSGEGYFTEGDDPPTNMAVSSLTEIQYYTTEYDSENMGFDGTGTNWSAEVDTDEWLHIAIVETTSTDVNNRTMYINGVEETRLSNKVTNGIGAYGDEFLMYYLVGAAQGFWGSTEHVADVFNGQIDAIRITKGALSTDDFLTVKDE